jgi:hypothetical protein
MGESRERELDRGEMGWGEVCICCKVEYGESSVTSIFSLGTGGWMLDLRQ